MNLLRAALPANIVREPQAWPRWQRALPHVLVACIPDPSPAEANATSWLLDRASSYLQSRAEPAAARPLLEQALRINEAAHGPDHPSSLAVRALLPER